MVDSSLWKDMQINDKLVIDTIRKNGKDTIYFKLTLLAHIMN